MKRKKELKLNIPTVYCVLKAEVSFMYIIIYTVELNPGLPISQGQ